MAVALHSGSIEIQEEGDDEEEDGRNRGDVEAPAQQRHPQKMLRSGRRRYRMLGMGFGLLCGVQALLNIGLRLSLYSELNTEKNNLQSRYNNVTEQKDQLQSSFDLLQSRFNNVTEQKDQLQSSFDLLQSRYNNAAKERDDLKQRLCESHGFTFDAGVCYYVSTVRKTWDASRQYCRDRKSDLMVINSTEKQDIVERVTGRYQDMWLGLTDRQTEGVWMWVDGTPLTTPTYWGRGQPDNKDHGVEDCDCAVFWNGGAKGWFDNRCFHASRWICERVLC